MKFKKGDRVRYINSWEDGPTTGLVMEVDEQTAMVLWDPPFGHSGYTTSEWPDYLAFEYNGLERAIRKAKGETNGS